MGVIGKLFGNEKELEELRQKNADLIQKLSNYEKVIQEMQKKISSLNRELKEKEELHMSELNYIKRTAQKEMLSACSNWEQEKEHIRKALSDIVITTFPIDQIKGQKWSTPQNNTSSIIDLIKNMKRVFQQMLKELRIENQEAKIDNNMTMKRCAEAELKFQKLQESFEKLEKKDSKREEILKKTIESNLEAMPYLAGMMADFLTLDIEVQAEIRNWGNNKNRKEEIRKIREIRASAKERIEEAKLAVYQLEYLKQLYPELQDVLETDYKDLDYKSEIPKSDPVRNYLSDDEWRSLSSTERNQRALDHYIESHRKTKWQIGRDYELSVGYEYEQHKWEVEYFGSVKKLDDMGRDLIAIRGMERQIIQCKYWATGKKIHEKHIFNLYGTVITYCIENGLPFNSNFVKGVFFTNIELTSKAKEVARLLRIRVVENHDYKEFPRVKCNIGKDEYGKESKIYHLPMDLQYDNVKIKNEGECTVFTVEEAERLGFRRAYKWHEV